MSEPKKPRNGNYTRNRGYRYEREFCDFMEEGGVPAERHFMSGMFKKGDCTLSPACLPEPLVGQCKRKKGLPKWLGLDGHDFAAVRGDRGDTHIIMTAEMFRSLLQ